MSEERYLLSIRGGKKVWLMKKKMLNFKISSLERKHLKWRWLKTELAVEKFQKA